MDRRNTKKAGTIAPTIVSLERLVRLSALALTKVAYAQAVQTSGTVIDLCTVWHQDFDHGARAAGRVSAHCIANNTRWTMRLIVSCRGNADIIFHVPVAEETRTQVSRRLPE